MKAIAPIVVLLSVVSLVSCSAKESPGNSAKEDNTIEKEYGQYLQKSSKSPLIEKKLFGGFEIGMTEPQVDSVIKTMYGEGKLVHFLDWNEDMAPVRSKDEFTIQTSVYRFRQDGISMGLALLPHYRSGRLVALSCSVELDKDEKYDKPPHELLAEFFQKSDRGQKFKKAVFQFEKGPERICFIKDNLEVSFYGDSENWGMSYLNIPDYEDALTDRDKGSSKDF